jgi:hypothetical protein
MSDVEALLEERRGYELRGLTGRVAQVDAALADLGFKVDTPKRTTRSPKAKLQD